mgnify:CR=1 FL=1
MQFKIQKGNGLKGEITVPGDKSISHRAIMLASLADGNSEISGFLEGEDCLATIEVFQKMGVSISRQKGKIIVEGKGLEGLEGASSPLDFRNSGTSVRLCSGVLVAQEFSSTLIGDSSLSSRPMTRITEPLGLMGANISGTEEGTLPIRIEPADSLKSINYSLPVASAQVKSCLLFAGLYSRGITEIEEKITTRDHTERMLRGFGYDVTSSNNRISLLGGGSLKGCDIEVPSDISSAAFFMVAGCISKDSSITLNSVNINPTRTGVIDILKLMGGNIELINQRFQAGELIADIKVSSSKLKGIEIPENLVPLAIDEFPVLFIAASCAEGETVLTGAKELRVKESDRIQVMADGLASLGIENHVLEDGIRILGGKFTKQASSIKSHHDHRISMAFAIASVRSKFDIQIEGVDNVKTSFPNFVELANSIGMNIKQEG